MISGLSPFGAFIFLVAGVIIQAALQRFLYPFLSASYERAKVTGAPAINPARIMLILRIVNFLVLPVIGLLAGGALLYQ
jgi:hypothetical protein